MAEKMSCNKGFSLIELIIVIAIMGVLVALIAPALSKYLGSSKVQTDKKNLDEVHAQALNCISDAVTQVPEIAVMTNDAVGQKCVYKAVYSASTDSVAVTVGANGVSGFANLLALNLKDAKTKSQLDKSKTAIKIEIEKLSNGGYYVSQQFDTP